MSKSFFTIKDTIAARLLTRVFYFYIIVTISVTLVHMLADFKATQVETEDDLVVFQGAFQPGLAIALWNQEDLGLHLSLLAMLKVPQIVGAKVFDESGLGEVGYLLC
jgi:two-component system sensor histidine kinase/response regulator